MDRRSRPGIPQLPPLEAASNVASGSELVGGGLDGESTLFSLNIALLPVDLPLADDQRSHVSPEEFNIARDLGQRPSVVEVGPFSCWGDGGSSGRGSFECKSTCLSLPVRPRLRRRKLSKKGSDKAPVLTEDTATGRQPNRVSKTASMERFDCNSFMVALDTSADEFVLHSMFFDLPLELIRSSNADDTDLPVNSAFVFDGGCKSNKSGVQGSKKADSSVAKMALDRFSSSGTASSTRSSDSCITLPAPAAREDLDGYLEAHSP